MGLIDSYRNVLRRKREELVKFFNERAKIHKKIADCQTKTQKAAEAARRSKSSATINSKLGEVEKQEKNIAKEYEKLAKIESKISAKQKEIEREEKKVREQEDKIEKQRQKQLKKEEQKQEHKLKEINKTLFEQSISHSNLHKEIEKLKSLPEKINVLFLAANPIDHDRLRLDEEVRAIQEMIRKSEHRESVNFKSCWAVRPLDVLQAINEHSPAIVHFSGHGSKEEELLFQDDAGNSKPVNKEAIVQIMVACSEGIRLVFFNTCYSEAQAKAVVQHVEAAIGMGANISDKAAQVFSSQFYSAIGFGHSVEKAFEQAKAALMLEDIKEENIPKLFVKEEVNPDKIIIVRPNQFK